MGGLCKCATDCITETFLSPNNANSILSSIQQCHASATQTVELCTATLTTSQSLVQCGESIQNSLVGADASNLDPSAFEVIADLIDGDKTTEAKELACTLKDKSMECIALSVQMVDSLESSVDALPDVIEDYIEKKAEASILSSEELTEEERTMISTNNNEGGFENDVNELSKCIDAIENLNLLTAIDAGNNAFNVIKIKSSLCHIVWYPNLPMM